jgi:hypothetical protein
VALLNSHQSVKISSFTTSGTQADKTADFVAYSDVQYRAVNLSGFTVSIGAIPLVDPLLALAIALKPSVSAVTKPSAAAMQSAAVVSKVSTSSKLPTDWSWVPQLPDLSPILDMKSLVIENTIVVTSSGLEIDPRPVNWQGGRIPTLWMHMKLEELTVTLSELQKEHILDCLSHFITYSTAVSNAAWRPPHASLLYHMPDSIDRTVGVRSNRRSSTVAALSEFATHLKAPTLYKGLGMLEVWLSRSLCSIFFFWLLFSFLFCFEHLHASSGLGFVMASQVEPVHILPPMTRATYSKSAQASALPGVLSPEKSKRARLLWKFARDAYVTTPFCVFFVVSECLSFSR